MAKYTKIPVTIEAWQWTPPEFKESMPDWLLEGMEDGSVREATNNPNLIIDTREGVTRTSSPGDWIIKGANGEIYPCKPDVFEKTYRPTIPMMAELTAEMESVLLDEAIFGKAGQVTWLDNTRIAHEHLPIIISDVQEVDPKTHPRGEPVIHDDIIQRADKLFNMGAMILCDRIAELEGQLRCEGEHTAAGQARIEELERQLADARRNATTG